LSAQDVPLMHPPDTVLQVWPRLDLQAPLPSHVPAQLSLSSADFTLTQLPPGPEQVWHSPVQSSVLQQVLLSIQPLPHGLKPDAHPDALQVFEEVSHCLAVPFCAGQSLSAQHPVLGTHFEGHFFMLPHVKSHFVPSHVAVAPAGTWHGSHEDPQLATEVLATQLPTQACVCPVHMTGAVVPPVPAFVPPDPDVLPPVPDVVPPVAVPPVAVAVPPVPARPPLPDEAPPLLVLPPVLGGEDPSGPASGPPVPDVEPPPSVAFAPPSGPLVELPPEPAALPPEPDEAPPEPAPASAPPEPPEVPPLPRVSPPPSTSASSSGST
jgi:hypothetical protein